MKMTKTARPTQNPITMESGERKRGNKMINILLALAKCCLPQAANPKQFAAYFWLTKRRDKQIYLCLFLNRKLPLKISF